MRTIILLASVFLCGHVYGIAESDCCHVKMVGEYSYTLVNSSIPVPPNCLSGCTYIRDDQLGGPYCFARGDLPVQCKDKDGYCLHGPGNQGGYTTVPQQHNNDCNRVIVRVNASELSQASIKLLDRAMHIIKGYNNSKLDSFENIASYHGKPYLCNNATATVPGQSKLISDNFQCHPPPNKPAVPCCLNHMSFAGYSEMFTPWHRLFTLQMELALTKAIPYWDWTSVDTLPGLATQGEWTDGPIKCQSGKTTKRNFKGLKNHTQQLASAVKTAYKRKNVQEFNHYINSPHNYVHYLVGGNMAGVGDVKDSGTAAYDPIFFLHHSEVDYQYAFWQELQRLRNIPVTFNHVDWKMQPFPQQPSGTPTINPFQMTLDNPTPPDGLDYENKFCYKYDQLLFQGQTPEELIKTFAAEQKNPSLYAGYTAKYTGNSSNLYFNLVKGSTNISTYIGPVSSFWNVNFLKRHYNENDLNEFLVEVEDLYGNDPLDKTLHFEVSMYVDYEDKPLPIENTYKPTVTYRKADTEHYYVMRLHVDHIQKYSPVITHCHIYSSVEFLNSDGNYSDQVTLDTVPVFGEFKITKMKNKFVVGGSNSITIGYYPGCHLQCISGLPTSDYPGIVVVPWNLNWIECHDYKIEIPSTPDTTVIIAWCQGQETDVVKVTNKKDFDDCNFGYGSSDIITSTSDGYSYVDGFIAIQHMDTSLGTYYFASRSLCKYGFKIAIKISG